MDVERASKDEVVFSVMSSALFVSLHNVQFSDDAVVVRAEVNDGDAQQIQELEHDILNELRVCSTRNFANFRDEYSAMFRSALSEISDVCNRVEFHTDRHSDKSLDVSTNDATITPVSVTVRPGSVHICWSIGAVDDPRDFEVPVALRANEALGRAARAKLAIERIENGVKSDARNAKHALRFLDKHGFSNSDDEV